MRQILVMFLYLLGAIVSVLWLAGFARAFWPLVADSTRDFDLSVLTYPDIKWYTEFDEQSGRMSEMQIDWFSMADGPTGIVYPQGYIPCWIVSLWAAVILVGSVMGIVTVWSHRDGDRV